VPCTAPAPPLAPPAVPVSFVALEMSLVPSAAPHAPPAPPRHPRLWCLLSRPRRLSPRHTRLRCLLSRHARPHHHLHATPRPCRCINAVRCLHRCWLLRLLHRRCPWTMRLRAPLHSFASSSTVTGAVSASTPGAHTATTASLSGGASRVPPAGHPSGSSSHPSHLFGRGLSPPLRWSRGSLRSRRRFVRL
jgi:hypothetical protein